MEGGHHGVGIVHSRLEVIKTALMDVFSGMASGVLRSLDLCSL